MDFSRLPEKPFLKIFKYLSFEECIRAGQVNKSFHRISQMATSQTKSLILGEERFGKLRADQLGVILDLCSPNLEKIGLSFESIDVNGIQLATKMASYHCPRLIDISFGNLGNVIFEQLIRNAPNLETIFSDAYNVVFPDVMNNNLKKLQLGVVNDATLQSMTDRCPNLKELEINIFYVTANVLDELLASVPQVNKISLLETNQIELENVVNLWQLPLVSLSMEANDGIRPGDRFMYKVASSFPHLQNISMDRSEATKDGVAALSGLQELEFLGVNFTMNPGDNGIQELGKCKKLRRLYICSSSITGATLIALLRGCPQLEFVMINAVYEVDTPGEAAAVLKRLSGIGKRDITIMMGLMDYYEYEIGFIWRSKAVKKALRKLEEKEGLKIKID